MRQAYLFALCLGVGLAASGAADAHKSKGKARIYSSDAYEDQRDQRRNDRARRYSQDSEADIIRAESCDPGGRFTGYPAWARAAFTCGSQR